MRNPEASVAFHLHFHRNHELRHVYTSSLWKILAAAFVVCCFLSVSLSPAMAQAAGGSSSSEFEAAEWRILTRSNFSSQIRHHPHILLLVTVPWSGESRSLMKEISQLVANKPDKFSTLKLMLLYKNRERMFADAIGATEGITIFCYHHSLSYKYRGRLRAQNILSSAHFLTSLSHEQLPLEFLKTPEDLKTFLQSTDKALLLLEFCGWTQTLLAKGMDNGTGNAFDSPHGAGFIGETSRSLTREKKKNQKGMENEKMTCSVQNGVGGVPWEFTSMSYRDSFDTRPIAGMSCGYEEFQRFESFFSKFMTVARGFFLPPERLRFGLAPERLLLSSLNVGDSGSWLSSASGESDSWLMILHFAGCSSCLKVLREEDDLKSALQTQNSLVIEEIATYLFQRNNDVKLSSLAKDVGFQLLSEDFDIKIQEALPTEAKPTESLTEVSVDVHEDQIPYEASTSSLEHEGQFKPANADESSDNTRETITFDAGSLSSRKPEYFHGNGVLGSAEDGKGEQKIFSQKANLGEEKLHFKGFTVSFFFSDGGDQLLRSLTSGSKIPSVVIVDPTTQTHYILPKETDFSYSSLSDFLNGFLNRSLLPYQRSETLIRSRREAPCPPFVNLDFHEVDSIPRVTTRTFSELVLGFNQSDNSNVGPAWKKDVLVLFCGIWCGFCQRMELVVREVYRAFKHYSIRLENGRSNGKSVLNDDLKDFSLKLPQFYFMDCSLNECSLILRSVAQRELYPSLLLFPAEKKSAVSYEGDVAVSDIIKFVIDHGNNAYSLVKEKGILQIGAQQERRKQNIYESALQSAVHKEAPLAKNKHHEVILKYRTPERVIKYNQIKPRRSYDLHGAAPQVIVGSLLIATDKLLNIHPFDKSTILIVKADQGTGFQGLITNKHISWDSLYELEEGLELLREARLSFGGPLLEHRNPLVALTRRTLKDHYPEVLPNIYFIDEWATVNEVEEIKLRNHSVIDYWFFLGYSSWGWDQLFNEIAAGAWNISVDNTERIDWPWR
ncbi:uncharacterized protein LOC127809628 isoform X3 [Diospyros lotus]|uniref:uncharacterized protein LOC127809628 isoform X3 n=1 Tax=Diospyros lotus TaxID=55363 RepID=UPI0022504663|nr:uncharacterized protein LOC127809628 isoform X3 [Diospyros lotus]